MWRAMVAVAWLLVGCAQAHGNVDNKDAGTDGSADAQTARMMLPADSVAVFGQQARVAIYPPNPTSMSEPIVQLDGEWLLYPTTDLTIDREGRIYCFFGNLGELGNVVDLDVDHLGNVYVADATHGFGVLVYGPNAEQGTPPERVIAGEQTGIDSPAGIAVDSTGRLFIYSEGTSTVNAFAPRFNGNVAPYAVLTNVGGRRIAIAP